MALILILSCIAVLVGAGIFASYDERGPLARGFLWLLIAVFVIGFIRAELNHRSSSDYDDLEYTEPEPRRR